MKRNKDRGNYLRRLAYIIRAYWNQRHTKEKIVKDELPEEDEVVTAVAERRYSYVYSDDQYSFFWILPFLNQTSKINFLLSSLSSIMIVLFYFLAIWFLRMVYIMGGEILTWGQIYSYQLPYVMQMFLLTASSFTAGALLRWLDMITTRRLCLAAAEIELQDRRKYVQERCDLWLQRQAQRTEAIVGMYNDKIASRQNQIQELTGMCDRIAKIENLPEYESSIKLAPYKKKIRMLQGGVEYLERELETFQNTSDTEKARILQSKEMAVLIDMADTLHGLDEGSLAKEIEELDKMTDRELKSIAKSGDDLHDDLLIEAGLDPNSNIKRLK